jgi:transposase
MGSLWCDDEDHDYSCARTQVENRKAVAWLQNFRRLVVRYERHAENLLGMLQLAAPLILLRQL